LQKPRITKAVTDFSMNAAPVKTEPVSFLGNGRLIVDQGSSLPLTLLKKAPKLKPKKPTVISVE
jgi:hypothetical protein